MAQAKREPLDNLEPVAELINGSQVKQIENRILIRRFRVYLITSALIINACHVPVVAFSAGDAFR